jgi:hypothetical protein
MTKSVSTPPSANRATQRPQVQRAKPRPSTSTDPIEAHEEHEELHDRDDEHERPQQQKPPSGGNAHKHPGTHAHRGQRSAPKQKTARAKGKNLAVEAEVAEELAGDSALATANAVTRKDNASGGDQHQGGNDGFDSEARGRNAYEQYKRDNVAKDAARIEELKRSGARDDFKPGAEAKELEPLGVPKAAAHAVRQVEEWIKEGVEHDELVTRSANWVRGFERVDNVGKVLTELESKPIRDVYPLEIILELLDKNPEALPGMKRGHVIGNVEDLKQSNKQFAGHPFVVMVPEDHRVKHFALLGGGRPGYEFYPHHEPGKFHMLVDTPGEWDFALMSVSTKMIGRMAKESHDDKTVEVFVVVVDEMGRKDGDDEVEGTDPFALKADPPKPASLPTPVGAAGPPPRRSAPHTPERPPSSAAVPAATTETAPVDPLAAATALRERVLKSLENVRQSGTNNAKPLYTWEPNLPGIYETKCEGDANDKDWLRAREAINKKIKELHPSPRLPITSEHFGEAFKRARRAAGSRL